MNHRFRLIGALLALIGLLTFSVQDAWAATCAVDMETESSVHMADAVAPDHSCADTATGEQGEEFPNGSSNPVAPGCPAMPMSGAGGCGAVLATLSNASPALTPPLVDAQISPRTDHVRDFLLANVFFRPPIA